MKTITQGVIHKWTLAIGTCQHIRHPRAARVLSVQEQAGELVMWLLVSPSEPMVLREIYIYGTGHAVDTYGEYNGTVQHGALVWHVFSREVATP